MDTTLPSPIQSILFVCWGNICRSPAAENVMRSLLKDAGLEQTVICDSSGTISSHQGNAPDPRMSAAGKRRGLPMTGSARGTTLEDLQRFDLIAAMDNANLADLRQIDRNGEANHKIRLFCTFCQTHDDTEVPDPYYGGPQGFEHVLDLLEDGCSEILKLIQSQHA